MPDRQFFAVTCLLRFSGKITCHKLRNLLTFPPCQHAAHSIAMMVRRVVFALIVATIFGHESIGHDDTIAIYN